MAYPNAREYYERGPSPWVPATILGVILLIATTPFRMAPDAAMAYQPALRPAGFPTALIWIPMIVFLVIQFLGGSYRPYRNDRYGRPLMRGGSFGRFGGYGDGMYPGGAYDNYNRYNGPYNRGVMSSFMDYGGHWVLILLGIWLFSLIGSGSAPLGGSRRYGFPWSLFAPQPQVVLPVM